jgi:hypothetical protein
LICVHLRSSAAAGLTKDFILIEFSIANAFA